MATDDVNSLLSVFFSRRADIFFKNNLWCLIKSYQRPSILILLLALLLLMIIIIKIIIIRIIIITSTSLIPFPGEIQFSIEPLWKETTCCYTPLFVILLPSDRSAVSFGTSSSSLFVMHNIQSGANGFVVLPKPILLKKEIYHHDTSRALRKLLLWRHIRGRGRLIHKSSVQLIDRRSLTSPTEKLKSWQSASATLLKLSCSSLGGSTLKRSVFR